MYWLVERLDKSVLFLTQCTSCTSLTTPLFKRLSFNIEHYIYITYYTIRHCRHNKSSSLNTLDLDDCKHILYVVKSNIDIAIMLFAMVLFYFILPLDVERNALDDSHTAHVRNKWLDRRFLLFSKCIHCL